MLSDIHIKVFLFLIKYSDFYIFDFVIIDDIFPTLICIEIEFKLDLIQ